MTQLDEARREVKAAQRALERATRARAAAPDDEAALGAMRAADEQLGEALERLQHLLPGAP